MSGMWEMYERTNRDSSIVCGRRKDFYEWNERLFNLY